MDGPHNLASKDDKLKSEVIDRLIKDEVEESKFSWGKAFLYGTLGKLGGLATMFGLRESYKNQIYSDVVSSTPVRTAMATAPTEAASKAIANDAMKKTVDGMKGAKGFIVKNRVVSLGVSSWAVGALAAGAYYLNNESKKSESRRRVEELERVKQCWAERISDEPSAESIGHKR